MQQIDAKPIMDHQYIAFDFMGDQVEFVDLYRTLEPEAQLEVKDMLMEYILFENGLIDKYSMTIMQDDFEGEGQEPTECEGIESLDCDEEDSVEKLLAQTEASTEAQYWGRGGFGASILFV